MKVAVKAVYNIEPWDFTSREKDQMQEDYENEIGDAVVQEYEERNMEPTPPEEWKARWLAQHWAYLSGADDVEVA